MHDPPVHRREGVRALLFALPYWSADRVRVGCIINARSEHIDGGALVKPTPAVLLPKSNGLAVTWGLGCQSLRQELAVGGMTCCLFPNRSFLLAPDHFCDLTSFLDCF